jgi:hypothetical protein
VSSSRNRESIAEHGLDWRRMTLTSGIAAGPGPGPPYRPELEAVFLCESLDDVEFFVGFGQHPLVDVWEVDAVGLPTEPGPEGWVICRQAIPAAHMRLFHTDRPPEPRNLSTATLAFIGARLTVEQMSQLAGTVPDDSGREYGEELGRTRGTLYSWWLIESSDRYAPLTSQVDELVARIAAAEHGLTHLAAESDEATFFARGDDRRGLSTDVRALLARIGVEVEGT